MKEKRKERSVLDEKKSRSVAVMEHERAWLGVVLGGEDERSRGKEGRKREGG